MDDIQTDIHASPSQSSSIERRTVNEASAVAGAELLLQHIHHAERTAALAACLLLRVRLLLLVLLLFVLLFCVCVSL